MRIILIQVLIKSFRRYLAQDECIKIMEAISLQLPDYMSIDVYDVRYKDEFYAEMDEAEEAAHLLGINAPKDTERTLN